MRKVFFSLVVTCFVFNAAKCQNLLDSTALANAPQIIELNDALSNEKDVIKLVLRKKKLKEFPLSILRLTNLQYLDLSKNNIKEIPDSISQLKNLQVLILSKNNLVALPATIGSLQNLKILNVNQNNLTALPYSIGKLSKLNYLDLWSNELDYFPESMKDLIELKWVDLRNILISQSKQDYLQAILPGAIFNFSPPCNCGN
ncbi:MAG: leucine-rich repeat domain-containing protein [Bacteroidetes bacterium]|nr:leucine-rich repeat domain-containing protein [Bacteroidota bacterium]